MLLLRLEGHRFVVRRDCLWLDTGCWLRVSVMSYCSLDMLVRFTAWRIYSDEEHYQFPAVRTDCRSLKAHNASLKHRPSRFRGLHFASYVPCPCFQSRSWNWLSYALCILHRPSSRMPDVWFNTACAISFRTLSKSVAVVQVTTKFWGGYELVTHLGCYILQNSTFVPT